MAEAPESQRETSTGQAIAVVAGSLVTAGLVAVAAGTETVPFPGAPSISLIAGCFAIAFALQWIAFVPAFLLRTEHFYDLVGTVSYLTVTWIAVLAAGASPRALLLAGLITIWSGRLGVFLFRRVKRAGKDGRFDTIKTNGPKFFMAWTLQGLWVCLTLAAALAAIADPSRSALGPVELLGAGIWLAGFAIEAVADHQKSAFKARGNTGFIDTGLWAWSRHPNYFGEIVLWIGIFVIAAPALASWGWVTAISPVFVVLLLTKVSGIPMLEQRADERWGGQPDYEKYKQQTPVLVMRPPR